MDKGNTMKNTKKGVSFATLDSEIKAPAPQSDTDPTLSNPHRPPLKGNLRHDTDEHNNIGSIPDVEEESEADTDALSTGEEDDVVLTGHVVDNVGATTQMRTLTEEIDDTGRKTTRRSRYILNPKKLITDGMYWMFGTSFLSILTVFMCFFYLLVIFFSLLIWSIGTKAGECVIVGGTNLAAMKNESLVSFASCFALSWTTFSTVGYGNVFPATQSDLEGYDYENQCEGMHIILMVEAFVGVLYAGCCGAILFGKVLRIQSSAQVQFSQPIVIRFGSGLNPEGDNNNADDETKPTCPILEFRLINELHNTHKGEIVDASINCVVSKRMSDQNDSEDSKNASTSSSMSNRDNALSISIFKRLFSKSEKEPEKLKTLPRRMFSKLALTHEEHPFFKRAWTAVHILDETSPLLTPAMRSLIREEKGWPKDKNHWRAIRESLDFYQIIVSVNGVSRMNNAHVYSQKIYDSVDVVIGYQFVHLLTKDEKGKVKLLEEYLNDVIKQRGSDEIEPLTNEDEDDAT